MPSFFEDPTWSMTPAEIERAYQAIQARAAAEKETAAAAAEEAAKNNEKPNKNGAGGPRTPEGKAISAQNARKHGFAAANPVISNTEDQEAWDAHLSSYIQRFQPADQVESDTVRRAALAMWKIDRISTIEATLFNLEFFYHLPMSDARLAHDIDPIDRMAIAFKESAGDHAFDLCRRYLHSATREHDHAIRTFYILEAKRKAAASAATAAAPTGPPPPTENEAAGPQLAPASAPAPSTAAAIVSEIALVPNELPRKPAANASVIAIDGNSDLSTASKTASPSKNR